MAAQTTKMPFSMISPRYLHTNSTSHTWPFSAIAGLIDNAYDPDVNAKQFWIEKTMVNDQDCLIFMDNGKGMDYDKMHKMLSFGFSKKQTVRGHAPVGLYGNGFTSGSMRLGKDAIVFSKKADTMCVGLLSQTYLEKTEAQNIIVPIVMFTNIGQILSAAPEYDECLHAILSHSLFNTKEKLLSEFSVIDGLCTKSSGTRIIIWNLRRTSSGELELDFKKDRYDIQIPVDVSEKTTKETKTHQPEVHMSVPESEYSLRAYCSILYLKPKMHIILQGKEVQAQFVTKTLANVFKDTYKPVCCPSLTKAIPITFGYNTKTKEHYGIMMYHKNRLIKAYERVPCQRKANSTGVGVIGVIECNYLTPTHNKEDFDNTEEYRKTMQTVGNKLEEYWKKVCYQYENCTQAFEDTVKRPDQTWVQCNGCHKWRKLPDCIDEKLLPKNWFCHMNPNPQFRNCTVEEEPEDSDEEQTGYKKTYKEHEKNLQKLLQEENNRQQLEHEQRTAALNEKNTALLRMEQDLVRQLRSRPSIPMSFIETTRSTTISSPSLTGADSSPSDDPSVDTQDNSVSTTPTRKKRALGWSQENTEKKKARQKDFDNSIPDKSIEKEENNQIKQASSEDKQNYEVQYLQAKEELKQLQHTVDSLENENCTLLTHCESLKKDLEELKRESEKMKLSVEDQGVQRDFPISSEKESATTATEAFNPGRGRDLQFGTQQHDTQDRQGSEQGNNNTQLCSEKYQKMQEEEKNAEQQSPSSSKSSCQTPSSTLFLSSHTGDGSRPSDITSMDTPVPSTPTRKRSLDPNQKNQNQKKARQNRVCNTPDSPTSTVSVVTDKNTVKEESNEIPHTNSEDQQNYEAQDPQANEMIKHLQNKVDSLEKYTLLTCCEILQKNLEEIKKDLDKVKASVEGQGVQTDFPISSHEESAATSAEASNSERGRNFGTQQHETQDQPEIRQENNNI
ncbi:MORC family CW-type zinc finger protein 3-like [Neoarius graeffei]|uniref:MORC family CW-type zinc finger protein 3-like n=1 Tax=Neoarius graeffei TaxID=443677 RepID=UPI00298C24CF|nr:MORC family CW-type zinc finger protein 3-like [Neoarius graeffei]